MLTLYTYDNQRPAESEIKNLIIKERSYTYLTATMAIATQREKDGLIPAEQVFQDDEGKDRKKALFADVLREWTKREYLLAPRGEAKTMLFRAMDEVSKDDISLRNLLRHDFMSWSRLLYDLAAQGIDLRIEELSKIKKDQLVNPKIEDYLKEIQKTFYDNLRRENKKIFEQAIREYLTNNQITTDIVIMEGFTFLTDLQKWFIEQCEKQGKEVFFLAPYNDNQKQAYQIIRNTYDFVWAGRISIETSKLSTKEDIKYIQNNLFADSEPQIFPEQVENVSLRQFVNRDRELQGCLEQIEKWFSEGLYQPEEIVIVTRRAKEFNDRFQDYLSMKPLEFTDENGNKHLVTLPNNPRLLLLTPVGRFILNLYQLWHEEGFLLESNEFESIIASGWLGASIQDSTSLFRAAKNQYFTACKTKDEWIEKLEQLERYSEETDDVRLPTKLIDSETVRNWNKVVEMLYSVCYRLFSNKKSPVAEHIEKLQEQLNEMLPEDIRKSEKEVLEKIREVFDELSNYYSIDLTTTEFGDALHAITRGENDNEDEEEQEKSDVKSHNLRIVIPETLDGIQFKAVIYVGCDNVHSPVLYPEPWPFYKDGRREHLYKERYMFMTVVKSVQENLVISYSQKDGDHSFQPSTYFQEIERVLGTKREKKALLDTLDISKAPEDIKQSKVRSARRKEYSLSEIAHYGLCPLRYRLEMLHPEVRMYRNEWQLEIYAQGVWLNRIFSLIERNKEEKPYSLPTSQFLMKYMQSSKEGMLRLFPAFGSITWHSIENQVKNQIKYFEDWTKNYFKGVKKGKKESFRVMLSGTNEERTVKISLDVPFIADRTKIQSPIINYLQTEEWLLPGSNKDEKSGNGADEDIDIEGVSLFPTQKRAVDWWRDTINSYYMVEVEKKSGTHWYIKKLEKHYSGVKEKIVHWINNIESSNFPKNTGDHCKSCPVRLECLGITVAKEDFTE
ncbi:hypothetical protein QVE09_25525 [Paenibacillus sp. ClWae2A]|uniref:hypothetical protein n=1 Tax=Paenibacillus sp. ClWae2A TaxID=3057177 RepID=UPI0028F540F2|nr:hypothetical protein [Paenibacillus sp. ClWae2A]MDT9722275.1 hypothetical protein [Paenibacillus sp. ClWae2A]